MRQSVCDRLEISERRWPRLALTLSRHVVECDHQSGAIAALSGGEGIERVPYAVPQEVEAEHDDLHSLRILQQHSPAHHGRHHAYSQEAQGALAKNETGYGEGEPRRRESDKRPQPVLDEVRERIDEILQEWGRRTTPKQRITGTLVHQQLLREGHQVGSTTVRAYLAEQRRARQEVYLPLVWRAGDGAQVDFFEVTVEVAGERLKAWLFVLRLMYSGRDFGWLYERCNQVAFLDGHVRAFKRG